jgi:UDP-3-O-[3-hydroxymyristoyl] glucosamine N-acyltransferase
MVYRLTRPLRAASLARLLGLDISGNDTEITCVASLDNATRGALIFSKNSQVASLPDVTCIAPRDSMIPERGAILASNNPRLDYIRTLLLLEARSYIADDVTPARIHPTAKIGPGVYVGPGCEISEGVVLEPNVVIMNRSRIGARSLVRANATIGSSGFGFERTTNGTALRFIHLGGVSIGCDVEIGANSCVARGTLQDTVIEDGAKIDNLAHISHNVRVCRDAFVLAGAKVCGGARIGKASWIGPNVCVREKVEIGDGALIAIGSIVFASVPPGEVHAGNPARLLRQS